MTRINGFYKRHTQIVLLFIGLGLAVVCNVNLLRVGRTLWTSAPTRNELDTLAEKYKCADSSNCQVPDYVQARKDLETGLNLLPIGYQNFHFKQYWADARKVPNFPESCRPVGVQPDWLAPHRDNLFSRCAVLVRFSQQPGQHSNGRPEASHG